MRQQLELVRITTGVHADLEARLVRRTAYGEAPRTLEVCEVEFVYGGALQRKLYWATDLVPLTSRGPIQ